MLTKATPYLLYPLAVYVVYRLTCTYSKNPASPEKATTVLSWCLTMAFVISAGVGLLSVSAARSQHWRLMRQGPFVMAAVSVLSGVVCAGFAGRHLRLGRTYRSAASLAGVGLGMSGVVYMAHLAVFGRLFYNQ